MSADETAKPKRRPNAWRNWSGGVTETSTLVAGPTSETAVKALVIGASGSGLKIKSVGSGHSFNDIATTEGLRLHFDDYRGLVSVNPDTSVATFRAGTKLHELPKLLGPYNLALANQGDIDAQTIAGAISTGTHGTGLGFSGLAEMVKSLRMVLADGSIVYCDERTHPDLFEFARLGLGALGVVLEVGIQCVPAFRVAASEDALPMDEVVESFIERARSNDHVEFFWFPHADTALVKTNRRLAPGEEPDESFAPQTALAKFVDEEVVQNWAHQLVASLGSVVPGVVPKINQFSASLMGRRHYVDDSHGVFVSQRRVRFNEMEYAVPLEDGPEVVREIQQLIDANDWNVSFPIEVRCAGADEVPLSTAYQRESMYISVHQYVREPHLEFFGAVEEVLQAAGGRPHWGKLHTLRADELRELYPRFDDFVALRNDVDPNRVFANQYLTRTLGE
ncbi:D-arabinono-1,4-lactone oxidase [Gulosibacter sediminis]|uniref:D-arabinono-1,4-lactone oxidase n=1 Tax=Gulosibacter sediminis TaxID=1729695 RepID=UPI0024AE2338|nr:D-arabinono-1,4-lactone oxidase [Gulosibacter sediminis]